MPKNKSALLFFFLSFISFLTTAYLFWQRYTPKKAEIVINQDSIEPKLLRVDKLNINLEIFKNQTTNGVTYLSNTSILGEVGNSVIYGHNWPNLLGNITKIKPGDEIKIVLANMSEKKFIVEFTQVVTPDQTYILNQTRDSRLTLYTCTGFLDRKRFVVTALLES